MDNLAEPPKDLSDIFFIHWVSSVLRRLEKTLEPLELRVRARESARVETSQQLLQGRTDNFTMAKHLKKEQANAK